MSSRLSVAGVPIACPPVEFDVDTPGNPAAMNCGGLILFGFILSDMVRNGDVDGDGDNGGRVNLDTFLDG